MANGYFFDSSSLVKRYVKEKGTVFVLNLFKPSARNQIYVSRLALVEVISALTRRQRAGSVSAVQFGKAATRFRRVFKQQFRILDADEPIIERASTLAEKHALRGYDAVQLATVLEVHRVRHSIGFSPLILVSADADLNSAARAESLLVDNPNLYP